MAVLHAPTRGSLISALACLLGEDQAQGVDSEDNVVIISDSRLTNVSWRPSSIPLMNVLTNVPPEPRLFAVGSFTDLDVQGLLAQREQLQRRRLALTPELRAAFQARLAQPFEYHFGVFDRWCAYSTSEQRLVLRSLPPILRQRRCRFRLLRQDTYLETIGSGEGLCTVTNDGIVIT